MQASSSSQREPCGPIGDEPLYRPSPFETAVGWLYGLDRTAVVSTECHEHPRIVLRDLLRRELLAGPCVVPFSGGRDSSMLLAVACDVAREAGVDQPTALTLVYPGHREADETTWQQQVLAHLRSRGLQPAWSQVRVDDEADVVGPLVAPLLHERRQVLWPPNVGATLIVARESHGATMLSGENGDEVLGPRRATFLNGFVQRRGRGLTSADRRVILRAATPRVGVALARRLVGRPPEWLNRTGRVEWRRREARDLLHEPLRWDKGLRRTTAARGAVIGGETIARVSADMGSRQVTPLADSRFIAALAHHGGARGLTSRSVMVKLLSGPLLPAPVAERRSKASFNESRFHRHTRAVLAGPLELGPAGEWVDAERLKADWATGTPHPGTAGLVQAAWLVQHGYTS